MRMEGGGFGNVIGIIIPAFLKGLILTLISTTPLGMWHGLS